MDMDESVYGDSPPLFLKKNYKEKKIIVYCGKPMVVVKPIVDDPS
jgi:hypothetical protein